MRCSSIICVLIGLTSISGAPTRSLTQIETLQSELTSPDTTTASDAYSSSSSSSFSSARKLPTHDVGLPSELAWQAWLVVDKKPDAQSSFESATVPRRISPKSVFVAPELQPACPDGYRADVMGRCVKETIQINYKNHLEFILERLRAKFPSTIQLDDSAATGPELKQSAASGPLQVNISLGIEENLSASRLPSSSNISERETAGIPIVRVKPVGDLTPAGQTEPVWTAYEVSNVTNTGEEHEGTFFRGNTSQPFKDHSIREVVVPVAEIIDDGNQTIAEVIDYEIPLSLGSLFNTSRGKPSTLAKNVTETKTVDDARQPTVVLLLSQTKLNAPASTPYLKDPETRPETNDDGVTVGTGNFDVNSTGKDGIPVNSSDLDPSSEDPTGEVDEEVTPTDEEYEETTWSDVEETVATTTYPEEDAEDGTESIDEILSHGEAGMLVSADKFSSLINPEESSEPSTGVKTVAEENGGNISSESSISGDVIVETTLLDLNTGTTPTHSRPDEPRELFEAEEGVDLEPEVVFSPQDSRRLDRPSTLSKKRAEELRASSSNPQVSSLINLDDSSTLDTYQRETVLKLSPQRGQVQSERGPSPGHLQQRRRTSSQEYVRFPDDQRQSSSGYVLFPPDNSNSINGGVNSKQRSSPVDESAPPHSMPKNSVPLHQKKTYWHLPPGWRIEDLQPSRHPVATQSEGQRQNPLLFRFWTRMPLFRDPSLTTSGQQSSRSISPMVTQRDSIYRSISPQGVNRVFGQTVRGAGGQVQIG